MNTGSHTNEAKWRQAKKTVGRNGYAHLLGTGKIWISVVVQLMQVFPIIIGYCLPFPTGTDIFPQLLSLLSKTLLYPPPHWQ